MVGTALPILCSAVPGMREAIEAVCAVSESAHLLVCHHVRFSVRFVGGKLDGIVKQMPLNRVSNEGFLYRTLKGEGPERYVRMGSDGRGDLIFMEEEMSKAMVMPCE